MSKIDKILSELKIKSDEIENERRKAGDLISEQMYEHFGYDLDVCVHMHYPLKIVLSVWKKTPDDGVEFHYQNNCLWIARNNERFENAEKVREKMEDLLNGIFDNESEGK